MAKIVLFHDNVGNITIDVDGSRPHRVDLLVCAMSEHPTFFGDILDAIELLPDQITMQNSPALDGLLKAVGKMKRALSKDQ